MKHTRHGKMILHGHGIGDLTDEDVEKRAREIALIRGQPPYRTTESDRAEAWAELQGGLLPETTDSDGESRGALSRDPSEPLGIPGHQTPNAEGEYDATNVERLASEGVEEAQHDQMLAARHREHRRSRH
jgi:hypothetical protein